MVAILTSPLAALLCAAFLLPVTSSAQLLPALVYKTGFEASEGYDARYTLADQRGWIGEGTGGNGLLFEAEGFEGFGQQAYIGFHPPTDTNAATTVWRPVDYNPLPAGVQVVSFQVTFRIVDSTNAQYDDFRWSVYNTNGTRLFSLEFENSTQQINYQLQDGQFNPTGYNFDHFGVYDLRLYMNFQRNLWTAILNDVVIANSLPITLNNSPLHLGDVDAVWVVRNTARPGDNYMVFDDYTVIAEDLTALPSALADIIPNSQGNIEFIAHAEEGRIYSIDVTSDFVEWFSLGEFIAPEGGSFLFEDDTSGEFIHGFYRLRLVE